MLIYLFEMATSREARLSASIEATPSNYGTTSPPAPVSCRCGCSYQFCLTSPHPHNKSAKFSYSPFPYHGIAPISCAIQPCYNSMKAFYAHHRIIYHVCVHTMSSWAPFEAQCWSSFPISSAWDPIQATTLINFLNLKINVQLPPKLTPHAEQTYLRSKLTLLTANYNTKAPLIFH